MSRATAMLVLAAIGFVVGALGMLGLHMPAGRDQGIFATAGLMLGDGAVLYRDVFEVKQPLILFLYHWAFSLSGRASPEVVNAVDAIVRVAALPVFYAIGARLHGRVGGLVAAAVFGLMSVAVFGDFWDVAQAETFAGVLLAGAFLAVIGGPRGPCAWALAGALVAAAAMFKVTAVLPGLAIVAAVVVGLDGGGVRRLGARLGALAVGAALVVGPVIGYFVAHDALDALIDVQLRFNRYHAWQYDWRDASRIHGIVLFVPWLCEPAGLGQTAALVAAAWLAWRGPTRGRLLALWWALAWLTIPIQGKLWQYHYALVLPPQALLIAWWLTAIARDLWRGPHLAGAWLGVLLIGFQTVGIARDHASRWGEDIARWTGRTAAADYVALPRFAVGGGQHYESDAIERAAEWLRAHAAPGDAMMVLGLDQTLNFRSRLLPPTRYLYTYPLVARIPGYEAERDRHRARFLGAIDRAPPRFLVVPAGPVDIESGKTPAGQLTDFDALRDWALARYHPATVIGPYTIFEKNPS